MIKHRPLYCPNVILLDTIDGSVFPLQDAKLMLNKHPENQKFIAVYINHEELDLTDLQIVVKTNGYAIYQEKNSDNSRYTSALLKAGAGFVYYIQTKKSYYRNAFVHFYDILAAEYPIICISKYLHTQVQASAIVLPSHISEQNKVAYGKFVLNPERLYTINEFDSFELTMENREVKIKNLT